MTDTTPTTPADTKPVPPQGETTTAPKAPEATTQPLQVATAPATESPKSPLQDPEFMGRLSQEVVETGDLTEESYKALEAAGFPPELVKGYVEGQKAQRASLVNTIHTQCGGEAAVTEALTWASKNLPPATVEAINKQLADPNPDVVVTAVKGLQARAGIGGRTVAGQTGGSGIIGYESEAQMLADMKNPAYRTDKAFRDQVTAKLAAAVRAGKISTGNIVDKGQRQ